MPPVIARTPIQDDDGSGTFGTVFENAWKQELYDQIDLALTDVDSLTATGTQHNFVIPASGGAIQRWNGASGVTFTGWTNGVTGRSMLFQNVTAAQTATFNHEDVNSTAANRFTCATGAAIIVAAGAFALLWYDATSARWRVTGLAASTAPQTTTLTGTQNDLALTANASMLRCNNATDLTISGLSAGVDGQLLTVQAIGAGHVFLKHQSTGSVAANRLINFATSGDTPLAAGVGTATLQYDATSARWRLVAHEQGAWITPTFAAGNYTGSGSMTWTVDSGDITTQSYYLRGRTLTVAFYIGATTVGGTVSTSLQISNVAYGGFTIPKTTLAFALYNDNGGGNTQGIVQAIAGDTKLSISKNTGNWALATNATGAQGEITFEVN